MMQYQSRNLKQVFIVRANDIAPNPRVEKAAIYISSSRYRVTILGWARSGKPDLPKTLGSDIPIERLTYKALHGGGWRNFVGMAVFNLWIMWRFIRKRPDIVHACDLDCFLPAFIYCKLFRRRFVYDICDFFADSRDMGKLSPLVAKIERKGALQADAVFIPHEIRLPQIANGNAKLISKIRIVYNSPIDEFERFKSEKCETCASDSQLTFSYVGILSQDRGISSIVEMAKNFQNKKVVIAGYGPMETLFDQDGDGIEQIRFVGRKAYDDALKIMAENDVVIALYDPKIPNNRLAAPNKLFEACMLGKPILTNAGTALGDFVEKHGIGWVVKYGDVSHMLAVIESISSNQIREFATTARRLYVEKFDAASVRDVVLATYATIEGKVSTVSSIDNLK